MSGSGETSAIPRYGVSELTQAIGSLLERGFAPRFLLDATVSRPQTKKGHLWLTLVDGQASISGVVWASQLAKLSFVPQEGRGGRGRQAQFLGKPGHPLRPGAGCAAQPERRTAPI